MFNEITNTPPANGVNPTPASGSVPPKKEVDDIFSETDRVDSVGVFSQARPQIEAQTVGLGAVAHQEEDAPKHSGGKVLKKLVIIFIILGILGAGAYFAYTKFTAQSSLVNSEPEPSPIETSAPTPPVTNSPSVSETPSSTPADMASTSDIISDIPTSTVVVTPTVPDLSTIDSDSDGLNDTQENQLGTNPNLIDSDNDGLSDGEEVNTYQTNPLLSDSDNDGFTDSVEIRGGYNPNGPGKLSR
ncbi:MAG: hypothetical protein WC441_03605 [Patescibacteria group bacterium]